MGRGEERLNFKIFRGVRTFLFHTKRQGFALHLHVATSEFDISSAFYLYGIRSS